MDEYVPLYGFGRNVVGSVDDDVPERDFLDVFDFLPGEKTVVGVLEPKSVSVANSLKLFLDDLSEQFARPAAFRLEHSADEQIDVVQITLVQRVQPLDELQGHT